MSINTLILPGDEAQAPVPASEPVRWMKTHGLEPPFVSETGSHLALFSGQPPIVQPAIDDEERDATDLCGRRWV